MTPAWQPPWFREFAPEFQADPRKFGLNAYERAVYFSLRLALWSRPSCSIADNLRVVAQTTRLTVAETRRGLTPHVRELFIVRRLADGEDELFDPELFDQRMQAVAAYEHRSSAAREENKRRKQEADDRGGNEPDDRADDRNDDRATFPPMTGPVAPLISSSSASKSNSVLQKNDGVVRAKVPNAYERASRGY